MERDTLLFVDDFLILDGDFPCYTRWPELVRGPEPVFESYSIL